jgi:uncharacterized repeat protein (TIGR03803 family)
MRHHLQRAVPIVLLGSLAFAIRSGAADAGPGTGPGSSPGESVLYAFKGGNDGAIPFAGLIADKMGALYGTTAYGGGPSPVCQIGCGTVFKLTPTGSVYKESVLYAFRGGKDGVYPLASLIADERGGFYGTTLGGGRGCNSHGCGTVFKLTPTRRGYEERVLYRFRGGNDGVRPDARLTADKTGALYSTTSNGGGSPCQYGCGTVFKLTAAGSGYTESVLYRFQAGNDGAKPYAGLLADESGALYGTTSQGGSSACTSGCGTVFKLSRAGPGYEKSALYRFKGSSDGMYPYGGLIADKTGALYSTTHLGGSSGHGTVFKLTPMGPVYTESVLYSFLGGNDTYYPLGGLIEDEHGALYGTGNGGSFGEGTAFKLMPTRSGYAESVIYTFPGYLNDGTLPSPDLIADETGALYGTTLYGGAGPGGSGYGTVFKLTSGR